MQFKNNVNFNLKQLKNAIIEKLSTAPTTDLVSGRVYYNTTSNRFFIYNGTAWSQLSDQSMTDQQILDAIKRVDGSGSGLDADLLDGNSSAYFMPASTTLNSIPAPTANVSMNGYSITGLSMPTGGSASDTDAANRKYVDDKTTAAANGLVVKESVSLLITNDLSLTVVDVNTFTVTDSIFSTGVDGQAFANGDRVLLIGETNKRQNGIFVVSNLSGSSATLTRASDMRYASELKANTFTFVRKGTTYGDTQWVLTLPNNPTGGVGFEDQTWTQYGSPGTITVGTGLVKSPSNEISIDTANGYGVRKFVYGLPTTAANTPIAVDHNLSTNTVVVSIIENSTGEIVLADVSVSTSDRVTVTFADEVTSNQYRVIVVG